MSGGLKFFILLSEFALTGHWIEETKLNQPEYDIECSRQPNGKIQCIATPTSGISIVNYYSVNGFEIINENDKQLVGTYDGLGTIRWLRISDWLRIFYRNWRRIGT